MYNIKYNNKKKGMIAKIRLFTSPLKLKYSLLKELPIKYVSY